METTTKLMLERALAGVCAVLMAGAAQAALQDRDLDGDTVVDAFYDTDLDITWLRDANVNEAMYWNEAVSWADGYSFGCYSDWRLPAGDPSCYEHSCTGSEMGHLWYVELGNPAGGPMGNKGSFQNLNPDGAYWSGTAYQPDAASGMYFSMGLGVQWATYDAQYYQLLAMAVRPGDVVPVPEPETYALMLAGLAGLALATRRRPR